MCMPFCIADVVVCRHRGSFSINILCMLKAASSLGCFAALPFQRLCLYYNIGVQYIQEYIYAARASVEKLIYV